MSGATFAQILAGFGRSGTTSLWQVLAGLVSGTTFAQILADFGRSGTTFAQILAGCFR